MSVSRRYRSERSATVQFDEVESRLMRAQEALNLSHYTLRNYRYTFRDLRRFATDRGITLTAESLTNDVIRDFQVWLRVTPLQKERHGSTKRSTGGELVKLRQVRVIVRWLADEGYTNGNVKVKLPTAPQRTRQALSEEQVQQLWQSRYFSGDSPQVTRNRAMLALFLDTGARVAEVASLADADWFLDQGYASVIGKGDKERIIAFSDITVQMVQEWIRVRDSHPIEIVGRGRGKTFEMAREGIQELFRKVSRDIGFNVYPHLLRHTAASMMLRRGMPITALQKLLGHNSIVTTMIYLTLTNDDLREEQAKASPMAEIVTPIKSARREQIIKRKARMRVLQGGKTA